jgi:putative transposase
LARLRRPPDAGVIFHSDRGSQYCGHEFQSVLASYKMKSSMSRKGDCWANLGFYHKAPTQSFWGRLKVGRLYGRKLETHRQAMDEVIDWMTFYKHHRIHSTSGYVIPMQFEKSWHAAQLKKAA